MYNEFTIDLIFVLRNVLQVTQWDESIALSLHLTCLFLLSKVLLKVIYCHLWKESNFFESVRVVHVLDSLQLLLDFYHKVEVRF